MEAGGQVGAHVVEALLKSGKHKITAITREGSQNKIPEGLAVKTVNYDDQASIVSALQGQDALIITMAVTAPPETEKKLTAAAAAAKVPFIMPNDWGYDNSNEQFGKDVMLGTAKAQQKVFIESLGGPSWISIACGFWYEFSLSGSEDRYGFDFNSKTVTLLDDGTKKIVTSTFPQTGRAAAAVLGLKVVPEDENDKSLTVSDFSNNFVRCQSFFISQKDMLESVERVDGQKWQVRHESPVERFKSAQAELQKGNRAAFGKMLYSRVFFPDTSGQTEVDNDRLGLPKEDLDEFTKIASDMAKNGYFDGRY
jgi:hypothetical protein